MKRDEQGALETLVAIGIAGTIFVVLMGTALIQDLNTNKSELSGWRPGAGPALTGPISTFIGPALSGTPAIQKCVKEQMNLKGFVYGGEGWRLKSGGLTPPTSAIGMDQNVFRGQMIAWKEGFNSIVAPEYAAALKTCQKSEQTFEKTTTTVAIQGRYRITIPENQTCSGPIGKLQTGMTSATASGSGSGFTLTVSAVGPLTGRLDPDRRFDVKGPVSGTPTVEVRMAGQFVPFGDTVLIRSGELVITAGETCRTTFEGEREKP